jgi:hypothetical protein
LYETRCCNINNIEKSRFNYGWSKGKKRVVWSLSTAKVDMPILPCLRLIFTGKKEQKRQWVREREKVQKLTRGLSELGNNNKNKNKMLKEKRNEVKLRNFVSKRKHATVVQRPTAFWHEIALRDRNVSRRFQEVLFLMSIVILFHIYSRE